MFLTFTALRSGVAFSLPERNIKTNLVLTCQCISNFLDHFKCMYFEFRQHAEEGTYSYIADVLVMDLLDCM